MKKEKDEIAAGLWRRVRRFTWLLRLCPYVRATAVCNTLATGEVTLKSDIDLFIIVRSGRLGLARFCMKVLTQLFGMRVHHEKVAGRFCLSFFVTEEALDLGKIALEFDPHLAQFVYTMQPLFGETAWRNFVRVNEAWVGRYLSQPLHFRREHFGSHRIAGIFQRVFELLLAPCAPFLEKILYALQDRRDRKRRALCRPTKSGIILSSSMFKFHENDPREEIAKTFRSIFP